MQRTLISSLALGALLTVACSGELSPGATVAQAAEKTRSEGTARVSYVATFDFSSVPGPIPLTGDGVFDYAHQRGQMIFDMSALLKSSSDQTPGSTRIEMIVDGVVVYLKMPFLSELVAGSRPWIKLDLDAAARANRTDLTRLTQLGQSDPAQVLELLKGVTRDVEERGEEMVRGARTTHYRATLELDRVVAEAPPNVRASLASLIARAGSTDIAADVWIDADGRLRKMAYELDIPPPRDSGVAATTAESMTVSMELYDFGVAVDVAPPPDDQVIDVVRLSEQQQG